MVSKIKEVSGDSIHSALDGFGDESSQRMSIDVLAPGKGTVITTFFTAEAVAASVRPDVTIISELIFSPAVCSGLTESATATWLYTVFGTDYKLFGTPQPANLEQRKQILDFMFDKFLPLVEQGKLQPMRVKIYEGGLDDINDGIDYMASGKVSAEKLVFRM